MTTLEIIGIIVAVVGGMKAIEYVIDKITAQHDKAQKIDSNALALEEYKKKTDAELASIKNQIDTMHSKESEALQKLEKSITGVLSEHKDEYLQKITDVESSITQMQAVYQQTVAVVDLKIENLEKAQNKHNNLIERMYAAEKQLEVQDEQIKVSNHRINDLEEATRKMGKAE